MAVMMLFKRQKAIEAYGLSEEEEEENDNG